MTNCNESTAKYLLGHFIDVEYDEKFLCNVSASTLKLLSEDLSCKFEELELTDDDVKDVWKEWFEWAMSNGTIINHYFRIVDADRPTRHEELDVAKYVLKIIYNKIDSI